jgi:CxxC-x17-CxxC domain-containing protein
MCGADTTVPFKPTQGRPVLCRSCFKQQTAQQGSIPVPQPRPESPLQQPRPEGD